MARYLSWFCNMVIINKNYNHGTFHNIRPTKLYNNKLILAKAKKKQGSEKLKKRLLNSII